MSVSLEDRIWAELGPAARREEQRPWTARAAAVVRGAAGPAGLRAAAGVALAVIALVAGAALVGVLDRPAPTAKPAPRKVQSVPISGALGDAAAGFGSVWIVDARRGLVRVDPATYRIAARVDVLNPWLDAKVAVAAGALWLAPVRDTGHVQTAPLTEPVSLVRVDPLTGRVSARVPLDAPGGPPITPVDLAAAADAVWVWGQTGALRIDPAANRVTRAIRVPGDIIKAFAVDGRSVWLATEGGRLLRFDGRTGRRLVALRIKPVVNPFPLVALPQAVVVDEENATVAALDRRTGRTLWHTHLAGGMRAAVMAGDRLWILTTSDTRPADDLVALDPGTGRTVARIGLPNNGGRAVAAVGSALWVTGETGDVDIVHP
jgi:PQQ-like domain